jgi:hypothetical protein
LPRNTCNTVLDFNQMYFTLFWLYVSWFQSQGTWIGRAICLDRAKARIGAIGKFTQSLKSAPHTDQGKGATLVPSAVKFFTEKMRKAARMRLRLLPHQMFCCCCGLRLEGKSQNRNIFCPCLSRRVINILLYLCCTAAKLIRRIVLTCHWN